MATVSKVMTGAGFLPRRSPMRLPTAMSVLAERVEPQGRRLAVELELASGRVPGVLLLPAAEPGGGDVPGALLLHGYASRKELMVDSMGVVLQRAGVASLAIDLPLHGDRTAPVQEQAFRNPVQLVRQWRGALRETTEALHLLGDVPGVDRGRLALVGYSMGSFVAAMVAADEPAARALVLAAGGDLPERTPLSHLVRRVADPLRAVRRLEGRPLLMVNGRHDRTITPEQAERLFAAAGEPKTLRWWDSGHYLPPAAVEDAARWLRGALGASTAGHAAATPAR